MRRIAVFAVILALAVSVAAQSSAPTLTLTTRPSPLGLGQNLFEATLKDANGQPVSDAAVSLLLLMPADPKTKHPEMRTEGQLNKTGAGKYSGIVIVTMAGDWDVTVTASRNGKELARKKQRLTAHPTAPKVKK